MIISEAQIVKTWLCLWRQIFVETNVLSRKNFFYRDKRFVGTSILLSRQKTCVAAPANDSLYALNRFSIRPTQNTS